MKYCANFCIVIILCLTLTSCGKISGDKKDSSAAPPATSSTEAAAEAEALTISDSGSTILWTVTEKGARYSVKGGQGETAAEIKIEKDRVKVSDGNGKPICKIKKKDIGCKVYDGNDQELYRIRSKEGELKIKDTKDNEIAHIRKKGDQLSVKCSSPCKVKESGGTVEINDEKGALLFQVTGPVKKEEACFLGITAMDPVHRIALLVFYREVH